MQQAKVYVVTEKEVEKSLDVIKRKAYINGKLARILIDPGTIFSFISSTF